MPRARVPRPFGQQALRTRRREPRGLHIAVVPYLCYSEVLLEVGASSASSSPARSGRLGRGAPSQVLAPGRQPCGLQDSALPQASSGQHARPQLPRRRPGFRQGRPHGQGKGRHCRNSACQPHAAGTPYGGLKHRYHQSSLVRAFHDQPHPAYVRHIMGVMIMIMGVMRVRDCVLLPLSRRPSCLAGSRPSEPSDRRSRTRPRRRGGGTGRGLMKSSKRRRCVRVQWLTGCASTHRVPVSEEHSWVAGIVYCVSNARQEEGWRGCVGTEPPPAKSRAPPHARSASTRLIRPSRVIPCDSGPSRRARASPRTTRTCPPRAASHARGSHRPRRPRRQRAEAQPS